jgi:mRNA-degrading endonuclease RelE of RelBE toxin-antitoxin system
MSKEINAKIEVYQSGVFKKGFDKLNDEQKDIVEIEIDLIIENPDIGERKKGDLSHIWVHKFRLNGMETLLGYAWKEQKLELYLLHLGPHENFYKSAKKRRKTDLDLSA